MGMRVRALAALLWIVAFSTVIGAGTPFLALGLGLLVPLYTRLAREHLLEDGVRPKIVDLLKAEPGLGITDVCQRLEIGWGTAVHHLTRLENAGLVTSQDAGRRRRFFLPGETAVRRTAVCVLSSDLNRRLLHLIQEKPGLSQQEVCAALSISAPLAHKYLARLIRSEFVNAVRHWRTVQYYPSRTVPAVLDEYASATATPRDQGPAMLDDHASPEPPRGPTLG